MYNAYTSTHAFWADTTNMDNLRGADSTGKATPGAQEVSSTDSGVAGFGNTKHTYSGDEIHTDKCAYSLANIQGSWEWPGSGSKCATVDGAGDGTSCQDGKFFIVATGHCNQFQIQWKDDGDTAPEPWLWGIFGDNNDQFCRVGDDGSKLRWCWTKDS